ncbi:unnamed protein product, partial [Gulo gulo]
SLQYAKILTGDEEGKKLTLKNLERICQGQELMFLPTFSIPCYACFRAKFQLLSSHLLNIRRKRVPEVLKCEPGI